MLLSFLHFNNVWRSQGYQTAISYHIFPTRERVGVMFSASGGNEFRQSLNTLLGQTQSYTFHIFHPPVFHAF